MYRRRDNATSVLCEGVQHVAIATNDIVKTVSEIQKRGVDVLAFSLEFSSAKNLREFICVPARSPSARARRQFSRSAGR
jgi:hypothetical protein